MRKWLPLFLLAAAPVFAATQSFGTKSQHHELRLDRTEVPPDAIAYDVQVIDLDTGAVVLASHITGKKRTMVETSQTTNDDHVHVRLAYTPLFFSATVNVTRGDTIVDEFRTWWTIGPRPSSREMMTDVPHINAPDAYRVGGEVKAPIVISRVEPKYTNEARKARVSGIVILEVLIGKDGVVKDAAVLKPLPFGLDQAAVDAVKQWRFQPGTRNGEPVDVLFNLTVNFKLDTAPPPE